MTRVLGTLKRILRVSLRVYRITAYVVFAPFLLFVVWIFVLPLIEFYSASVVLPNGMVVKHRFNLNHGARDIEFVCFNDRWIKADGGIYDGKTGRGVGDADYEAALDESGLWGRDDITCDGYYTGMLGASLLYDGNESPFLPPCEWRNVENKPLRKRAWLERPCDPREPIRSVHG